MEEVELSLASEEEELSVIDSNALSPLVKVGET